MIHYINYNNNYFKKEDVFPPSLYTHLLLNICCDRKGQLSNNSETITVVASICLQLALYKTAGHYTGKLSFLWLKCLIHQSKHRIVQLERTFKDLAQLQLTSSYP